MKQNLIKALSVFLFLTVGVFSILAEGVERKQNRSLMKPNGEPVYTKFNINNISTWIKNDGESDINQNGNSGFVFPKGNNQAAIFQSGFLWGGKIDGEVRVGGSVYRQGLVPGRIESPGVAADPNGADVRIYRVRKDWETGDMSAEISDGEGTEAEIRSRYQTDWNEWPADQGAPYEDVNGNGTYEPGTDIPGFPGADQTVWFVANDLDAGQSTYMYGSPPMGIEMQATIWGYKSTTALGNVMFRKYKIINKNASQKTFEDMYVSMWSDPDVGDANDDYVGCDTTLSLAYAFNANANDATYGNTPPAAGFDFFQGPVVDAVGETAIFDNRVLQDKKNLPMTAFYFFINSDAVYTDPKQGEYPGSIEFYNLFQGKVSTTGDPFVDPVTGQETKFALTGDPLTGEGWVDGLLHPPGDRRMGMVSGPFTMAYDDTQEVVVAEIAAGAMEGVDRLGAVALLKFYDLEAQQAYNNFFDIPTPPQEPKVRVTALDQEIVINWGWDEANTILTESADEKGFKFQGYNVYQFPTKNATLAEARRIGTYDIVDGVLKIQGQQFDAVNGTVLSTVLQFGTDSGIQKFHIVDTDAFNSGLPLVNGKRYYFGVSAYSFNADPLAVPNVLENSPVVYEIVPQTTDPGVRYEGEVAAQLEVEHSAGVSDGIVKPVIVDPSALTGDEYEVSFREVIDAITDDGTGVLDTTYKMVWDCKNLTTGSMLLTSQENLTGDENYIIIDGIQLVVSGPAAEIKGGGDGMVEVAWDGNLLSPDDYDAAGTPFNGNKVWHNLNSTDDYYISSGGDPGDIDRLYRFVDFASPRDFELRFTDGTDDWAVYAFEDDKIAAVPFEIWDIGIATIDDASDDKRMIPFLNNNGESMSSWGWATGEDPYYGYPNSDWIYWMDPNPETIGYDGFKDDCVASGGAGATYGFLNDPDYFADFSNGFVYPIGRLTVCDFAEDGTPPPPGTTVRIIYTKPITTGDLYRFTAPNVINSQELAKEDVEQINIFPNPYYGVNTEEVNKYQRFVTFNHLPEKATIRIFNLAGQLVRTIEKENTSQYQRWDLLAESGLPVASGLYIVYIDMPDLGKTKILKSAIIQEQQILDRF